MNSKALLIVLALAVALLAATPLVNATPSTPVSGTITITGFAPLGMAPKGKSDNVVVAGMMSVMWEGDIAGSTTYKALMMLHNFVPPTGGPDTTMNIHERIVFQTVTVLGKSGSLTLEVNFGGSKEEFRWTITGGTGDLVNLHGNGIYYLDEAPMYAYGGEVHFDP